ncbi:MAG TPA: DUF192 domain-containing protein [Povalibacter sp.]|uniref:DUF192 domain-containing protein n=1 Tax=Povalibacter sp. TaxID=1962978 RepID=UPI002D195107|nr:DUF192 domain-containing protein [Povalibacter sp.]HMN46349.1 DUF192 domain-containing protein [Povalibacter sp.]
MKFARVDTTQGLTVAHRVTIAASFWPRFRGLLGHREMAVDHGLLLRPGGSVHTIGMRFAIDVLFLDRHLRILAITHQLTPYRFATAPSGTRSVLELAAGRAADCGLMPGASLWLRPEAST